MAQERTVPTPAQSDLPTYKVLIGGQEANSAYGLMGITVSKKANRINEAQLVYLDGDVSTETFEVSDGDDFIPGMEIEITAGYHGEEESIFKGIVVKQGIKITAQGDSVLIVTAKHKVFMAAVKRNNRVFEDCLDSDAIDEIFSDYDIDKDVEATDVTHEHLVQFNASDWDFAVMRAEMNGQLVLSGTEKIWVKKPDTSVEKKLALFYGTSLLEFEAEMDARNTFSTYKVKSWSAADGQPQEEEKATVSLTEEGNLSADDMASSISSAEQSIFYGGFLEPGEMTKLANSKELRKKLSKIRGRAKCIGIADLNPGDVIELNGVGDRYNGKAFVGGVRHFIGDGKWETDIEFGLDPKIHAQVFDDITDKPAAGLLPAVNGLQIGVVAQLENDPKGENRILVKIPMVNEQNGAVWARVSSLDAGKDRGAFFLPEMGDEVILGFLNDDPRNAVVLGMLNSSKLPAPLQAKDSNPQRGFVTREKMKFLFDDEKKVISIETAAGNKITISEEDKAISIVDQNSNSWKMDSDGISIESSKDFKVKATGDIKLEGINVELKASANLKAEGSGGAAFKSSGITEVKGSMVNIN